MLLLFYFFASIDSNIWVYDRLNAHSLSLRHWFTKLLDKLWLSQLWLIWSRNLPQVVNAFIWDIMLSWKNLWWDHSLWLWCLISRLLLNILMISLFQLFIHHSVVISKCFNIAHFHDSRIRNWCGLLFDLCRLTTNFGTTWSCWLMSLNWSRSSLWLPSICNGTFRIIMCSSNRSFCLVSLILSNSSDFH